MTVVERPLLPRFELERWDIPTTTVYAQDWEAGLDGWTASTGANVYNVVGGAHNGVSGVGKLSTQRTTTAGLAIASKAVSGFVVGRQATITVYVNNISGQANIQATVGVNGLGASTSVSPSSADGWVRLKCVFTPTATSHTIVLTAMQSPAPVYWDSIKVTQVMPGSWLPYAADATSCTVRRGGSRSGLGIKTDVGRMAFTLHNAQDPLNGGAFKVGQTVRAVVKPNADEVVYSYGFENVTEVFHPEQGHFEPGPDVITGYTPVVQNPAEVVYSHGFETYSSTYMTAQGVFTFGYETTADPNWTGVSIGRNDMSATGNKGHSGNFALFMSESVGTWKTASYVRTGLEVGRQYEFSAWVAGSNGTSYQARIGHDAFTGGAVNLTGSYATSAGYQKITYYFTATATSHTLTLSSIRTGGTTNFTAWDDISLTRSAYYNVTNDGLDGWSVEPGNYISVSDGYIAHSGAYSANLYSASSQPLIYAKRTVTGLTPGRSYTFRAWGAPWSDNEATLMLRVTGVGTGVPSYTEPVARSYTEVTYTFTATSTSHELVLDNNSGLQDVVWDDISLTRDAYPSGGDPIYGPGPDEWVVDEEAWTEVTNDGLEGWSGTVTDDLARSGRYSLAGPNNTRTFTGLVIGASYVLSWWAWNGSNAWVKQQTSFTATSTSRVLTLTGFLPKDDVTLVRTYPTVPIFTGTVSNVKAAYPLNKATGEKRTSVTVEVSDAVKQHVNTPRYGAMIGAPYYETFEQRITRLAGSSLAPIEPPPISPPIVRYSF